MNFEKIFLSLLMLHIIQPSFCQSNILINIWGNKEKPFYKENTLEEYFKKEWGTLNVYNVTEPTLEIFPAKGKNQNKCVLILPGGGYSLVAINHEGYDIARILSEHGITSAVLKYRLPNILSSNQPHKVPLIDTRKALKILRTRTKEFKYGTDQIGIIGFSAGSHLAAMASLLDSGNNVERPNFVALIYGVTRLKNKTQIHLEENLFYRKLTIEEEFQLDLINLINENTPPTFLVHAYDDSVCHVSESTDYAEKLFEKNIPVEMHLFAKGGHGFGLGREIDGTDQWLNLFISWLSKL